MKITYNTTVNSKKTRRSYITDDCSHYSFLLITTPWLSLHHIIENTGITFEIADPGYTQTKFLLDWGDDSEPLEYEVESI